MGQTRLGTAAHPKTLAVLLSDGPGGSTWMSTGKRYTQYRDLTGHRTDDVWTNNDGWGELKVNGGPVSVWVEPYVALSTLPDPRPYPASSRLRPAGSSATRGTRS